MIYWRKTLPQEVRRFEHKLKLEEEKRLSSYYTMIKQLKIYIYIFFLIWGWGGGQGFLAMRGLGTDHVILGPMRGLEKTASHGTQNTDRKPDGQLSKNEFKFTTKNADLDNKLNLQQNKKTYVQRKKLPEP